MNSESEKSPEAKMEHLKGIVGKVYDNALNPGEGKEKFNKLVKFAAKIRAEHPHFRNIKLYQVIGGGTVEASLTEFDTPDHEIENFIINELA